MTRNTRKNHASKGSYSCSQAKGRWIPQFSYFNKTFQVYYIQNKVTNLKRASPWSCCVLLTFLWSSGRPVGCIPSRGKIKKQTCEPRKPLCNSENVSPERIIHPYLWKVNSSAARSNQSYTFTRLLAADMNAYKDLGNSQSCSCHFLFPGPTEDSWEDFASIPLNLLPFFSWGS